MQSIQHLQQAYKQAPWRKQVQLIGAFLLVLIATWMIAAMYLDVTARAAAIGREVQEMQVRTRSLSANSAAPDEDDRLSIEELKQINANLETQLAFLRSDSVMVERARGLGFEMIAVEQITYLQVSGYVPRQVAQLAPPPGPTIPSGNIQRPEPQSMLEWLGEEAAWVSQMFQEVQP